MQLIDIQLVVIILSLIELLVSINVVVSLRCLNSLSYFGYGKITIFIKDQFSGL